MSARTVFLSRLLGLFIVLAMLSMIAHRQMAVATVSALVHNPALLFVVGLVTLAAGIALVLGHNVWSGGALPVVVTLIGWLTLAKGMLLLFIMPEPAIEHLGDIFFPQNFNLLAGISLVLGIYLIYGGFKRKVR